MPNWCKNNLRISSETEKLLEVVELLKNEKGEVTFSKFMPMPEELEETVSPVPDSVPQEERDRLVEKYGADNWYDWHYKNWGVKWDASEGTFKKVNGGWIISFQTPWGPPIEFVKALSRKFKDIEFEIQYADETGDSPLGSATFNDGTVMYYEPNEGSDEAEAFYDSVWDEEWVYD